MPASAPTPSRQRQRRKDARPLELLDAALELFVEKGFAAARAEEVAQRAGVSKGTLYLYYPSKEELFKAVIVRNLSSRIADTAQQVEAWRRRHGAAAARACSCSGGRRPTPARPRACSRSWSPRCATFPRSPSTTCSMSIEPGSALIGSIVAQGHRQRRVPRRRCRERGAFAGAADGDAVRAQAWPVGVHATPDRRPALHRRACGPGRARSAPRRRA